MKNLPKKGIERKRKQKEKGNGQKLGDLNVFGELLSQWGQYAAPAVSRSIEKSR